MMSGSARGPWPRLLGGVLSVLCALGGASGCGKTQAKGPEKKPAGKAAEKPKGEFRLDEAEVPLDLAIVRPSRFYVQFADAFILWHFDQRWKKISPPVDFLIKGTKSRVDTEFAKVKGHTVGVKRGGDKPWDLIGWGRHGALYHNDDIGCQVYTDPKGRARLIMLLSRTYGCDTMILSSVSSHPGEELKQNLAQVRTGSGIGLGDTRRKIERTLGKPSIVYPFRDSQVLWYLGKPEAITGIEQLDQENHQGYASAYLLKQNEVVEILLHFWSDETAA